MDMTDGDRRIHTFAEAFAVEEFVKGDQARVPLMWVLTRLVHGITQVGLDVASNLAESKKVDAGLQVWIDEVRRKATLTLGRTDVQGNY